MEQLVNFIIRPPRADYSLQNDLLEPKFMLKGRWFQRKDLEVKNGKGLILQCSHYTPLTPAEGKALPCVIYCHGNSGCRADASEAAIILLPSNITVFTLDFSGSGLSEGEHVTLGWNEKEDLKAVVNHLRNDGNISCIGLWGRSMGAVTSLMYGAEDPSIAGMVLDSPFSNLVDLMMELVDTYKYPLPKFTVKLAIQHMRRVIKKKANFDIMELDTIKIAKCSFVPALFGHATDDDFIHPHHSDRICDAYIGDKNIIKFDGDHNSPRPQFYFDSITIFFHNVLSPPMDVLDEHYYDPMNDYFIEDNWEAIRDLEYSNNHLPVLPLEPSTTSTEDAINQVRLRRPMSRMEVPSDVPHPEKSAGAEEKGSTFDICPSSSGANLDSCNGSNSLFVPTTADDKYLEYSFGSFPDMPDSVEEEERMLMEAVMMSLKEFSLTDGEEQISIVENATSSDSSNAMRTSDSQAMCSSTSENDVTHATESASTDNANCKNDLSGSSQSSSGASSSKQESDMVGGTQARLVVQKSTASNNILDGLAQKWGNFFRNSG